MMPRTERVHFSERKREHMGKVIGIDLGTTNSCVSVIELNEPVIVTNHAGGRTTPSVVAFSKNGERLVGEAAKRQAVTNPDRTIESVKRHMGTNWSTRIDGKDYKAQTISAMILMQLKKDAEDYLGEPVTDAVITVPAYFNDAQRQATKDAGKIAGLNVLRIINEPTSAAMSYGLDHGEPQTVMIYDLGGGTFDVSIIEIGEGIIEVLATAGDNHLGGDDFDARVADWIVKEFKTETRVDLSKDFAAMQRVKEAAEKAKKELSTAGSTQIILPYITQSKGEPLHLDMTLTRARFNELVKDLVARTEIPVRSAMADAGISNATLNRVLLVGGSTRMPIVQEKVKALTGKEPSQNINPDECVAKGAAILGSTLQGNALMATGTGQSLLLMDVTPMSLSIETVGGVATRLIERNTTIPTEYTKVFSTAMSYQSQVEINVLQGERPLARDNKSIGKFRLKGIRRAPAGVPQIEVKFDIDANGILKVSAKDLDTGKEQSITIEASDRMSEAEIQQAMWDAKMYEQQDHERVDALELVGEAGKLASQVNQILKDKNRVTDKADKKQMKKDLAALQKLLSKFRADKVTPEQVAQIRQAKIQLESSSRNYLM